MLTVLAPYRSILVLPGAFAFSALGLVARLEIAMVGLGSVLLVQHQTGSYAIGGAVAATFGLSSAVLSPWTARLVDRHGQGRMLRLTAPLHAGMLVLLVLAAVLPLPGPVLFGTAAIAGASQMSVGSMIRTRWALLIGGTDRLHTAFALESVLDEVVFIVGPIVVTLLATLVHPAVGVLVAAAAALIGTFLLAGQRHSEPPPSGLDRAAASARTSVLRMRGIVVIAVVFLAAGGLFGSAEVTVAAVTREAGVPAAAGLVLALWALGSMLSGLVYGAVHWRTRPHHRFVAALVLLAVLTAPMAVVPTVPLLAVVFLLAGVAIAPVLATGTSLVEALVPAGRLTEGLAWVGTALAVMYSVAAALTGAIIDTAGPRSGFLVTVGCAFAAAVAGVLGTRRLRPAGAGVPAARSGPAVPSA